MLVPMIGCASHRFNLAVKYWIGENINLTVALDKLSTLMSKAQNKKTAARLRDLTYAHFGKELVSKKINETRWTSVMTVVERYFRIKDELDECPLLQDHLLDRRDIRSLQSARDAFNTFYFITLELQEHGIDLKHCRDQFDELLRDERFGSMAHHLAPQAEIVHSPNFESGVIKILSCKGLTDAEAQACAKLRKQTSIDGQIEDEATNNGTLSTAERLNLNRKRRRLIAQGLRNPEYEYVDASQYLCATSNVCERLFSQGKYVLTPQRKHMSPILFEAIMFLKKNIDYWDIRTVGAAIQASTDAAITPELQARLKRDYELCYEEDEIEQTQS